MRKERLIVPLLLVLLLGWLAARGISSLSFERGIARALDDLAARGELVVSRHAVERGWWSSSGRIRLAPRLGDGWRLELDYRARHGVLSSALSGTLNLRHGVEGRRLFGDTLAAARPRWQARYRTLNGVLEGGLRLAPFRLIQGRRTFEFGGGELAFSGVYGHWRLQGRLAPWRLADGEVWLSSGAVALESRYAYTAGAQTFTQRDRWAVEALTWHQPQREVTARDLVAITHTTLDDQELRLRLALDLGTLYTAGQVLLTGGLEAELSRLNAEALRRAMQRLRHLAGGPLRDGAGLLAALEPWLLATLQDSPRLDLLSLDLDSPLLKLDARVQGALFFDGRDLTGLTLVDPNAAERERWRQRLDGDFVWRELPAVVALWLGLGLDTDSLQIDIGRGQVRVNGRPLPPLLRRPAPPSAARAAPRGE